MKRMLCLGAGYCAQALARRLQSLGWSIIATTRSPARQAILREQGMEAVLFSSDQPLDNPDVVLAGVTHILSSIPPDALGDLFLRHHGAELARHAPSIKWAGVLSTTGVYGDHGGGWVDEETPPTPLSERDRNRLLAENQWLDLARTHGLPAHIFRLGGIYGPDGRNPLDAVRQGTARRIVKPGQYFGRIHRDDITGTLEASITRPYPGRIYNVVDDEPTAPEVIPAYAAELLGLPVPPAIEFADADLSSAARSFYAGSKRVSNRRLRQELGYSLLYPTYREGLRALLGELR